MKDLIREQMEWKVGDILINKGISPGFPPNYEYMIIKFEECLEDNSFCHSCPGRLFLKEIKTGRVKNRCGRNSSKCNFIRKECPNYFK